MLCLYFISLNGPDFGRSFKLISTRWAPYISTRPTPQIFKPCAISDLGLFLSLVSFIFFTETDRTVTDEEVYLVDSGGQYKDGTTDVTRSMHFGTPKKFEKECFTRVLKGQISVRQAVFPSKIKGNYLDTLARMSLWEVGLDYSHGTGHGVGAYLNVHEGPMGISWRPYPDDPGLQVGMVLSNEPGCYLDGEFGKHLILLKVVSLFVNRICFYYILVHMYLAFTASLFFVFFFQE
jgi:methionine aminopeptidase